jgi:ubiquinone/menaquinone biosynthesis C-methylase UbiE
MGLFSSSYKSIGAYLRAHTAWGILLVVIIIVYILLLISRDIKPTIEGFDQPSKYQLMNNRDIYDDFYADVYDELFLQPLKIETEVKEIMKLIGADQGSKVLDIGCGKGHHVDQLQTKGARVVGMDKSTAMIKHASELYPSSEFMEADALDPMAVPEESFSAITCLSFTLYYIKDKRTFFSNCYRWLKPEGYLIIHLVDRNHFDPIVPAGKPLLIVSPQSVANKRITNSVVKFNSFQYKADFKLDKPQKGEAQFSEVFKDDKTGKIRENVHTYYMPNRRFILDIAKEVGFVVTGQYDLTKTMNEYQYLYFLQK